MSTEFAQTLLKWNMNSNNRPMPWKGEKDPYRIWLSEIILQQTRVEQGWEYYNRFVKTYPNVDALASAPPDDVMKLWEGLGYYSRCRNLHETAKFISEKLSGKFPSTYEGLLELKGVGSYTAAAIGSFAFDIPVAVIDGNVQRIIARYFGICTPIDTTHGKKLYNNLAVKLLAVESPALYNQAIMDFGATICKPQKPLCTECPYNKDCEAYLYDNVKMLPVKEKKMVRKQRYFNYFLVSNQNGILMRKRSGKDIWQSLFEFFLVESDAPLADPLATIHLIFPGAKLGKVSGKQYRQLLTHQVIHGQFYTIEVNKVKIPEGYEFISTAEISKIAFPGIINLFLEEHPF
ncbi:MAG: A/G-specific adenine glycosylase [Flavitalea sp.]